MSSKLTLLDITNTPSVISWVEDFKPTDANLVEQIMTSKGIPLSSWSPKEVGFEESYLICKEVVGEVLSPSMATTIKVVGKDFLTFCIVPAFLITVIAHNPILFFTWSPFFLTFSILWRKEVFRKLSLELGVPLEDFKKDSVTADEWIGALVFACLNDF